MKRAVQVYKGLNSDRARDSINEGLYIDALDIRITTDTGESQGGITNIKGNTEYFTLPTSDLDIGVTGNMEIIGATAIRNTIIFFTTDDSTAKGWIFTLEYSDIDQTIIGTPTIVYKSNELFFSKDNPIEAVGRYESGSVQKVYWMDYNNYFRAINIKDPVFALPYSSWPNAGLIDIFPSVEFTQPLLTDILGGGGLTSGTYQYSYRLKTSEGKQTLISPPSNMIHVVQDSESEYSTRAYTGNKGGAATTKATEITIDISNYTQFSVIELIAIIDTDSTSTPQVFSVEEKFIDPLATSIVFTHTGVEDSLTELTLDEFTLKTYPFKTSKTLSPKDNSLVVANIKGAEFSIQDLLGLNETFEAKTGRYDNTAPTALLPNPIPAGSSAEQIQELRLKNAFNVEIEGSTTAGYNQDAHWDKDWHDNAQYKFQSNGTRLGGEGPNITYNFHVENFLVDNVASPAFASINHDNNVPINLDDGYGNYANTTWDSQASPFFSGLIRGYKRGETYRFGIVFYDKKGGASAVEYIGDIKFPDISEEDGVANSSGTTYFPLSRETDDNFPTYVNTTAYALGIKFTLNFSSCPIALSKLSSYQIVRMKRTIYDSKRLCSGIMKASVKIPGGSVPTDGYDLRGPGESEEIVHIFPYHQNRASDDAVSGSAYGINGSFSTINNNNIAGTPHVVYGAFVGFYSPDVSYTFPGIVDAISSNACLLMTGRYGQYYSSTLNTTTAGVSVSYGNNSGTEGEPRSFDILSSAAATTENLGSQMEDHVRKLRSVGQVDKSTSTIAIEYIKKYKDVAHCEFTDNRQDDAAMAASLSIALGPYSGYSDVGTSSSLYFRNFNAYLPYATGIGLNDHKGGGTHFTCEWSKSASGMLGALELVANDPLKGTALATTSTKHFFRTGTTAAPGLVKAVVNEVPLNKTEVEENKLSTPILDVLIPRKEVYGGFTSSALENNVFIMASPVIKVTDLTPEVFGGDIFLNMFTFQESSAYLKDTFYQNAVHPGSTDQEFLNNKTSTITMVTESRVNIALAFGSTMKTGVEFDVSGSTSGVLHTKWRQETDNHSTTWGKLSLVGSKYNMYQDSYEFAFSNEPTDRVFFIRPSDFQLDSNVNDIRAYISQVKTNGELVDSWTKFGINDFLDVDDYGPINKILNWRDEVYFFQDKAIGSYSINPRAVTSTTDGIPTELGAAKGLTDHKYLSTNYGAIHQWAVAETEAGIYSFDGIHKKVFRTGQGVSPLSEIKGLHGLLKNLDGAISLRKENGGDNPIRNKGVHVTKDKVNNEVIFTFLGTFSASPLTGNTLYSIGEYVLHSGQYYVVHTSYTSFDTTDAAALLSELLGKATGTEKIPTGTLAIVFDEAAGEFSTRFSATPKIYLENGNILLSPNPAIGGQGTIYQHNKGNWGEFYGVKQEMSIQLVLNDNADLNKVLRTIEFNSIVRDNEKNIDRTKTITAFRVQTEYQDTGKQDFSTGRIKRRFDKWRLKIPRDDVRLTSDRLRSTYFILTLYFDNTDNRELILDRILYYYDIQIF